MTDIVVDSSVVTKWVITEQDTQQALRILNDTFGSGAALVVLDLAFTEVASAVWKQHRMRRITRDEAFAALRDLFDCPVTIERSVELAQPALEIAIQYDRSIYDALFVALVRKTGFPGVTADEALFNAVHADFPTITLLRDWK